MITVRLPKAPDALPGREATELMAWVCNDLADCLERCPLGEPPRVVIEPDAGRTTNGR